MTSYSLWIKYKNDLFKSLSIRKHVFSRRFTNIFTERPKSPTITVLVFQERRIHSVYASFFTKVYGFTTQVH